MSAAMLFAQPWRAPAEFFTEQHDLGRRPGQLEASTAMARALFDVTGQREILLDQLRTLTMPTLVVWGGSDYVLPAHHAQAAVDRLPAGGCRCSPTAGTCPTWSTPTGSPPCSAIGSPKITSTSPEPTLDPDHDPRRAEGPPWQPPAAHGMTAVRP